MLISFQELKDCFESQDVERLQQVIRTMPEEDARYHMKRCVDSGLWKPSRDDPNTNPEDGFKRKEAGEDGEEDEEEAEYGEIGKGGENSKEETNNEKS